uniref:zinc-ribbon domain-containing protein n=1 Tax=Frisingicoccus sp. TaxID=1918627 RepID=UPI0025B8288A
KDMICRRCGKKLDKDDRFCRACGMPVGGGNDEKESGYQDDIMSMTGRFDGKYMLLCAVILGALIIVGAVVKLAYAKDRQGETYASETTAVSECPEWMDDAEV